MDNRLPETTKACPFCGGLLWDNKDRRDPQLVMKRELRDGYGSYRDDEDAWSYDILCKCCGCEGPWAKSETDALRMWQTRTYL